MANLWQNNLKNGNIFGNIDFSFKNGNLWQYRFHSFFQFLFFANL